MNRGINAANHRWTGSLVKRDYLHSDNPADSLIQGVTIQYQEVSHERATKAYHWSEHLHEDLEIIAVNKGTYVGQINGQDVKLSRGDILIVGNGDLHSDQCTPPLDYYAIRFDVQMTTDGQSIHILRRNLAAKEHIHHPRDRAIFTVLKSLFKEEERESQFALQLQQSLAHEVFWRVVDDVPTEILNPVLVKHTRQSDLLMRLTRLFEERRSDAIKVKDMATILKMSESALAHACTELLGVSPAKAFACYRQEKAKQMLQHTNLSIKEIAAELGYHDESHFIHRFRKEHGATPGSYRERQTAA
jgi:AraC-like DNA-binding protein